MNLKQIAADIPAYEAYPTIDEQYAATRQLAATYPDLVRVTVIGETRAGSPIELITVGEGERNVLAFGGPHPCEPIGCLTIDFMAQALCQNERLRHELGYQWHFIRCLDIDGMRLNEGWFKGPFTPLHYYRNMFRPLMPEQPEMLFPITYKTLKFDRPMPETVALKSAIDSLQPALMLSLHNGEFGGAFYYISRRLEPVFPLFREIPGWFEVPLDLGESDQAGYIEQYAPAIYRTITVKDGYERRLASGIEDPARHVTWGGTSNEYADERYGTLTLLIELPYWTEDRINDSTPTAYSRRQVFSQMINQEEHLFSLIKRLYQRVDDDLTLDTPFRRAISDRIDYYLGGIPRQRRWLEQDNDLDRPATVAERFRVKYRKEFEWMRMRGMFVRMLNAEVAAGNDADSFMVPRELMRNSLHDVAVMLADRLNYREIPIRNLVSIQVCAGLAAAEGLRQ
jgi:hypothetical protein